MVRFTNFTNMPIDNSNKRIILGHTAIPFCMNTLFIVASFLLPFLQASRNTYQFKGGKSSSSFSR